MPEIRMINLYCLAIFDKITGESRVFTFKDTSALIDCFCVYKDSDFHPYTFTQTIYVTFGHPLFDVASPLVITNSMLKIK